ncbi:MAG: membrane protein insertase YidC [Desulfobaccales bacterium]
MEKRALLALTLSFIIFMVFMYLGEKTKKTLPPAPVPVPEAKPVAPAPPATLAPAPVPAPSPPVSTPARPARDIVVDTPLYRAVFTEQGAALKSFRLKKFRDRLPFERFYSLSLGFFSLDLERWRDPEKASAPLKDLVRPAPGQELPLRLSLSGQNLAVPADLPYEADRAELSLAGDQTATLRFTAVTPHGVTLTRTYRFNAHNYVMEMEVSAAGRVSQPVEGQLELTLSATEAADRKGYLMAHTLINRRLEETHAGLKAPVTFTGKLDWAVLDEGYFLLALAPANQPQGTVNLTQPAPTALSGQMTLPFTVSPGQTTQAAFTFYAGPKETEALAAAGLGLERLVHFGWFDILAKPLLYSLKFIDRAFHNYGWSLIILTLIIRLVFLWPNHKSFKSMKEMQKLQPRVAQIREKYKDDREAMNRELMALYRTFKVNPLGGCLPMLLQLPVFIALYNILTYAIELRHAAFISTFPFTDIVWLADLSAKDPLLITPIVMGASMVIQQKMTPTAGDPTQAKMMMFLPIIFTFLFLNFAAGLVIYWLVNNILAIIQQHFTNKYLA